MKIWDSVYICPFIILICPINFFGQFYNLHCVQINNLHKSTQFSYLALNVIWFEAIIDSTCSTCSVFNVKLAIWYGFLRLNFACQAFWIHFCADQVFWVTFSAECLFWWFFVTAATVCSKVWPHGRTAEIKSLLVFYPSPSCSPSRSSSSQIKTEKNALS